MNIWTEQNVRKDVWQKRSQGDFREVFISSLMVELEELRASA